MILEIKDSFGNSVEVGKVIGSEYFPLDDGKVDFNLVEPTGMNRAMNENESRKLELEAFNGGATTMGGAIVNDPKHAARVIVGRTGHHLFNEPVEGSHSITSFTSAKNLGAVDVERSQIGPGAASFIFVFDLHGRSWLNRKSGMKAAACLDAGFLISGEDEFVIMKGPTVPDTFIKIQDAACFRGEFWIARKYPGAVLPRADRVRMKPTPDGAVADGGDQTRLANFSPQLADTPSRQWNAMSGGQLTGESLNLNDQLWGGKPGGARGGIAPQAPRGVPRKSAFATCSRPRGVCRGGRQWRH